MSTKGIRSSRKLKKGVKKEWYLIDIENEGGSCPRYKDGMWLADNKDV
jgi:hypothetical protein